ncbi:MAG TPA: hypothetical protein PK640_18905 [Verrucomicrobiota bacterium]|nr:hypothetical protein [Verrucomicrobiota bacterium]
MRSASIVAVLGFAVALHGQTVIDITPEQQPSPKPKFRVLVDPTNTAPTRLDLTDILSRSNRAQTMRVRLGVQLRADGTAKGGTVSVEADLSGAAARNLWLSLENGWSIPTTAKTNLMGKARLLYTNSVAAEIMLEYR